MIQEPLTKLYVENTSRCNLQCRMCLLNDLDEPTGLMSLETFASLLDQLRAFPTMPEIHFAGYGEPTSHPKFVEMVRLAKEAGAYVGVTTNGTLIDEEMSYALVEAGLDRLVVSIDGVSPESYADVRLGSMLPQVIENMRTLRRAKIRLRGKHAAPKVGIAFVAMKRNIHELPEMHLLASRIGATEVIVSNVVPHTPEMESEILYERAIATRHYGASDQRVNISIPKMDLNAQTLPTVANVFDKRWSISLLDAGIGQREDYCRFIEDGYAAVRWDGAVSPCLDLLHTHVEYIHGLPRTVNHHAFGNINEQPLADIWEAPEYLSYREGIRNWEFSGCVYCAGCSYFGTNTHDCTEKAPAPVCGGCLWSQGLVQCP